MTDTPRKSRLEWSGFAALLRKPVTWLFLCAMMLSWYAGNVVKPTWSVQQQILNTRTDKQGRLFYTYRKKKVFLTAVPPLAQSPLRPAAISGWQTSGKGPRLRDGYARKTVTLQGGKTKEVIVKLRAQRHWGWWSLLPALVAVLLCWLTLEPTSSLFGGILSGALLLGRYDITDAVLLPNLGTKGSAGIILLYLWLLGGLLGIWSRTGAPRAFAEAMTKHFVRGPRSAKLVAWLLGVIFFQGGTISAVLVGTTVKPLADRENISHEELAYIVDSTSSPIASQIAFNAWPGYVQAFIFVPGVVFLATEADRVAFFFKSVPFCFYAIFAVLGTFLLSIDKAPFLGKQMKEAIKRARETGELDAPDANPLSAKELTEDRTAPGYIPHVVDFVVPLLVLLGVAIGTFVVSGSPKVRWAFFAALASAFVLAMGRGMSLAHLMVGFGNGLKSVVQGSVILILAVTIGAISKEAGGGLFLVELLGGSIPYWLLPVALQLLTIVIAFSTGTSWGTYAVAFPLAMPLAWAVAQTQGLAHPMFFMTICFAAVMDGSVYGDQCSPISDTTVLSAMSTGCDLMHHVKTQIPQASLAAGLAAICWTGCVLLFA